MRHGDHRKDRERGWAIRRPDIRLNVIEMTQHAAKCFGGEQAAARTITLPPLPCRTLEDFSDQEIREIEAQYGCRVAGRYAWSECCDA